MFNFGLNSRLSTALAVCFLVGSYHAALSDCPTPEADKKEDDFRRDAVGREARSLKLALDGDKSDVTLVEEPVLRWGNVIRGGADGGTFLWTAKGRPVATCCIWWSDPRTVCLAFGSLTETPIRAKKEGRTIWHSAKPGLEYHDVPDAPTVAGSSAKRLTQLRNIARQFSAVLVYGQGTEELRLLPQPLYRYPGDDVAIKDGAVFAFVTGTDPEAILQIEAVSGESDTLRWRYAVTRRTSGALRVSHKDKEVWTCSRTEGAFDEPFFVCPAR